MSVLNELIKSTLTRALSLRWPWMFCISIQVWCMFYCFHRYDPEGYGTINGEKMMKMLGITIETNGDIAPASTEQGEQQAYSRIIIITTTTTIIIIIVVVVIIIIIITSAVHATAGRWPPQLAPCTSILSRPHPLIATNFLDVVSPSPFGSSSYSFSFPGCPFWCYLGPPGAAHSSYMSCPLSSHAPHSLYYIFQPSFISYYFIPNLVSLRDV